MLPHIIQKRQTPLHKINRDKMHKRGAALLRTGTEKYWLITYINLRDFTLCKGIHMQDKFMVYWFRGILIIVYRSLLHHWRLKWQTWKQILSATCHVIKMVVYGQTVIQSMMLFRNYIKEYYLKSMGFSTHHNNTFWNVSPYNNCELPIIFRYLISSFMYVKFCP
jgi:hypothetical protein